MYERVLVATDGSEPANRAVDHALSLARKHGSEVHALAVVDTGRYGEPALSSSELVIDELEDRANEVLSTIRSQGDEAGIEVVTRCVHGVPHDEIVSYGESIDADVVILGSHGLSHTGHHIGSVADRVARSTTRPLMLT
ncbi:universal stress protein [Halomicroarcula sp. GCM10025709]|uniref:universal stress protein n=1 Tax=Haloarcula TaxID=2237 RepID=UPI0024C3B359|nr:universal stress protein [Halomicroarcula sp. YJ-61-S]